MSVLDHHLIFAVTSGAFFGLCFLVLILGAKYLDYLHEKRQQKAVEKTSPSLVSIVRDFSRKHIVSPIKKVSVERREKRLKEIAAIRPSELFDAPPAVAIAIRHRIIRYKSYRLILSDYEDGTTSALVKSGKDRYRLKTIDTGSRSDDEWKQLLKNVSFKTMPVSDTSTRSFRHEKSRLILQDSSNGLTYAYVVIGDSRYRLDPVETKSRSEAQWQEILEDGDWMIPRREIRRPRLTSLSNKRELTTANRWIWIAGAFDHLIRKHSLIQNYARAA